MGMGKLRYLRNIDYPHIGIGGRFKKHKTRRRGHCRFKGIGLSQVNEKHLYPEVRKPLPHKSKCAAIECFISNDFITGLDKRPEQRGNRTHT